MRVSDWRSAAILSGGLGLLAVALGVTLYLYEACAGLFCSYPHRSLAVLILYLGASGILVALFSNRQERIARQGGRTSRRHWAILALIIWTGGLVATSVSVALWLSSLTFCYGCGWVARVSIDSVTFESDGSVILSFSNAGTRDAVLTEVRVWGPNITNYASVTLSTGNLVPKGGALSLTITFQGVTWQPGGRYEFAANTPQGDTALTSAIA